MNEELFYQLYKASHTERETEDFSEQTYTQRIFHPKMLAELVVRECLALCDDTPESGDEWDRALRAAKAAIKQRFGLE